MRCGGGGEGGGLTGVEQLPFIMEGDFAEVCFTTDEVEFDKPKIIH